MRAGALLQLGDVTTAVAFLVDAERTFAELQQAGALGAMLSLHASAAAAREDDRARSYAEQALALLRPADPPNARLLEQRAGTVASVRRRDPCRDTCARPGAATAEPGARGDSQLADAQ